MKIKIEENMLHIHIYIKTYLLNLIVLKVFFALFKALISSLAIEYQDLKKKIVAEKIIQIELNFPHHHKQHQDHT